MRYIYILVEAHVTQSERQGTCDAHNFGIMRKAFSKSSKFAIDFKIYFTFNRTKSIQFQ